MPALPNGFLPHPKLRKRALKRGFGISVTTDIEADLNAWLTMLSAKADWNNARVTRGSVVTVMARTLKAAGWVPGDRVVIDRLLEAGEPVTTPHSPSKQSSQRKKPKR